MRREAKRNGKGGEGRLRGVYDGRRFEAEAEEDFLSESKDRRILDGSLDGGGVNGCIVIMSRLHLQASPHIRCLSD